jgi:hypothetical protein
MDDENRKWIRDYFAGMGISDLHEIIAVLEDMIEEKEEELWVVKE